MHCINYIHLFFLSVMLVGSFFLIVAKNPVYSVLLLILIFFCASSIAILFGVDFMGILFLIVYVGAVAVLFLFVVMMLDLKLDPIKTKIFFFLIPIFFFFFLVYFYEFNFGFFFQKNFEFNIFFSDTIDPLFNIDIFGQCLYNYFLACFLIAGIVLLLSMLGAISLTLRFSTYRKNQIVAKQLARTNDFLTFFK